MENRDIRLFMRNATDYEELQKIIAAANEEIKRRQEQRKGEYRKAINDALCAAYKAGFKIILQNPTEQITIDDNDYSLELR